MARTTTTLVLEVSKHEPDKRRDLTSRINSGLCANGIRVLSGVYEVAITRVTLSGTERRYLNEINAMERPIGWGNRLVPDGRKGPSVEVLHRLEGWGLIKPNGRGGWFVTSWGMQLLGEKT